jgi:hypothetical protein
MRTREERVGKISEKMKSNKLKGYHGEKAQDFKNKYTEDVKTAATGRRSRKRDRANENNSAAFKQNYRTEERRKEGMTREEQKAKYGNA